MTEQPPADVSPTFADLHRRAVAEARIIVHGADVWAVFELPSSFYDRRSTATLVFEREQAMHRVRTYPADWRSLPDEELLALIRREGSRE